MRRAVAKLTVLKLLGALLGLAYSVSQARIFGATALMDAYFVAMAGVYMITSLAQGGQLAEVFIPEYLKAKHHGSAEKASALFSAVVTRMVSVVLALSALAIILAPFMMTMLGPGLSGADREMAVSMFRWAALLASLTLFSSFVNTTLNAEGVFGRAETTGLVSQAISLALIWLFHAQAGIWILVYSQTAGAMVELASGAWFLRRKGIHFRPSWSSPGHDLPKFFRVLYTTSGYVAATQVLHSAVTACASLLPAGSLSIFNYVRLYYTKASTLLLGPLSTVLFSKLANLAAQGSGGLAQALAKPIRVTTLATCSIAAIASMAGRPILEHLLDNPSFDNSRLDLAHSILSWGFVGVIASGIGTLFRRAAISLGKGQRLYLLWIAAQILSALASFVAIRMFGEKGLAYITPVNTALLALVSVKVCAEAGTNPRNVLMAIPWDRNWSRLSLAVVGLPWLLVSLPVGNFIGELPAAGVRTLLYLAPLAWLSAFLWSQNRRPAAD